MMKYPVYIKIHYYIVGWGHYQMLLVIYYYRIRGYVLHISEYEIVHYFTQKNMRLCITTPELQEVGILVSRSQDISRRNRPGKSFKWSSSGKFWILQCPQNSVIRDKGQYPQSITLQPQFWILNAPFFIHLPQISFIQPQFSIVTFSTSILTRKCRIFDTRCPQNSMSFNKMFASAACTTCSFFQVYGGGDICFRAQLKEQYLLKIMLSMFRCRERGKKTCSLNLNLYMCTNFYIMDNFKTRSNFPGWFQSLDHYLQHF